MCVGVMCEGVMCDAIGILCLLSLKQRSMIRVVRIPHTGTKRYLLAEAMSPDMYLYTWRLLTCSTHAPIDGHGSKLYT